MVIKTPKYYHNTGKRERKENMPQMTDFIAN